MKSIFDATYHFLKYLESITGFTYREVNVIIWFYILPFIWLYLLDKIKHTHKFKIIGGSLQLISILFISDFEQFSNRLFEISATFLRSFDILGSNYTTSSVIICLLIPLIISVVLVKKAFFSNKDRV